VALIQVVVLQKELSAPAVRLVAMVKVKVVHKPVANKLALALAAVKPKVARPKMVEVPNLKVAAMVVKVAPKRKAKVGAMVAKAVALRLKAMVRKAALRGVKSKPAVASILTVRQLFLPSSRPLPQLIIQMKFQNALSKRQLLKQKQWTRAPNGLKKASSLRNVGLLDLKRLPSLARRACAT